MRNIIISILSIALVACNPPQIKSDKITDGLGPIASKYEIDSKRLIDAVEHCFSC
jgi:hypothetical protein